MVLSFCEFWSSPECIFRLGESSWGKKDSASEAFTAWNQKFVLGRFPPFPLGGAGGLSRGACIERQKTGGQGPRMTDKPLLINFLRAAGMPQASLLRGQKHAFFQVPGHMSIGRRVGVVGDHNDRLVEIFV
jgi:hypothetical protein